LFPRRREISQGKEMPTLILAIKKDKPKSKLSKEQLKVKLKMLKKELGFD